MDRRLMIKGFAAFVAAMLMLQANTQAQHAKRISETMAAVTSDKNCRHASISMSVYNLTKDKLEYAYDADRFLIPASVMKVFSTAAGFEQLGKDFRFKTSVAYSGNISENGTLNGDIYIIGGGDPILGSYRYRQTSMDTVFKIWMKAVQKEGIKSVNGRVCYDASVFDDRQLHDSWGWGDIGNYYGAGAVGLNFHENMYFAYFNSGKRENYPATLDKVLPKGIDVRAQNEVTTGAANSGDQVVIYGMPSSSMRYYTGSVPLGKNGFKVRGSLPNPGKACAELFSNYLKDNGINVVFHASSGSSDMKKVKVIFDYYSVPYYLISQYTNMTSNNLYAESIFKYLGYRLYGKGNFENGAKAVFRFINDHGLDNTSLKIADGCGLSRNNLTTTRFLTEFLAAVYGTGFYSEFRKTLPQVGKSGTTKNLINNLPEGTQVSVKSGTMQDVKSFAGYATRANGDELAFALIINNCSAPKTDLLHKVEQLLVSML